jgi:hypothetical protein
MGENIAVTEAEDYILEWFYWMIGVLATSKMEYVPLGPF